MNYVTSTESLKAVADAIRAKSGGTDPLTFPQGFVDGIGGIKPQLTPIAIRPDAELIATYSYDKMLVADEGIEIPEYSTTATTLKASVNLTPTQTLDYDDYDYYVAERFLTIPTYSISTVGKGREEYQLSSYIYEIANIPGSSFKALINGKLLTSRTVAACPCSLIRMLYWSSASAISLYTATTYGLSQVTSAPTISSGVMTLKSPAVNIRGNSTYLASTYYNAIEDVRLQYVIDVYRAPKRNLNVNGWGVADQAQHISECIDGVNNKLT